jgi:hypothetical protein
MKVKVINSIHAWVNPGMIGEAAHEPSLEGYAVTFNQVDSQVPGNKHKKDITILMLRDEFEILEDTKIDDLVFYIRIPKMSLRSDLLKLEQENPDAFNTIANFFAPKF